MLDAQPAPDLANLFRRIAYALCEVVADHIRRDRNSGPMLEAITISLFSKMRRFDALFARFRAGAVFPPLRPGRRAAPAAPVEAAAAEVTPSEATPAEAEVVRPTGAVAPPAPGYAKKVLPNLPRKKAWLTVMMPWVVALYAIRLRAFVDDPASAAFLAACPQARAMLRDLWWALSSDPLPDMLRPDMDAMTPLAVTPPAEAAIADAPARALVACAAVADRSPAPPGRSWRRRARARSGSKSRPRLPA